MSNSNSIEKELDQLNKLAAKFASDSLQITKPDLDNNVVKNLETVLEKYIICLKSEPNLNRLFHKLSSQTMMIFLRLVTSLSQIPACTAAVTTIWKILRIGLFSKTHSNIFTDFIKNLPKSFSAKSNYQVVVLFNTLQKDSSENVESLKSVCGNIHLILKEIHSISNLTEYKHRVMLAQFVIDMLWALRKTPAEDDLVIKSIAELIKTSDELSLFNPIDDQNNGHLFKNFLKDLVQKTFVCQFNEIYADFLIQVLSIDHQLLDSNLETILINLNKDRKSLDKFLLFYLNENLKYRQLPRMTKKLYDTLRNFDVPFSLGLNFFKKLGECLESLQVDTQSILDIWRETNRNLLSDKTKFKSEALSLLNTVLSRVNMTNLPLHLKNESFELLRESEELIFAYLNTQNLTKSICKSERPDLMLSYLECCHACGFVYIILARFSLTALLTNEDPIYRTKVSMSPARIQDANRFLNSLNNEFKLAEKLKHLRKNFENADLTKALFLNKLQMINIYASRIEGLNNSGENIEESILNEIYSLDHLRLEDLKEVDIDNRLDEFSSQSEIENHLVYRVMHTKLFLIDFSHVLLINLRSTDKQLLEKYFVNVIKAIYLIRIKLNQHLKIDLINMDYLFNSLHVHKQLTLAFLNVLNDFHIDSGKNSNKKNSKFFTELVDYVQSNCDSKLRDSLFQAKIKPHLTQTQIELFQLITEYVPIEFLNENQIVIYFLLNERIKVENDPTIESFVYKVYFRLFSNAQFTQTLPGFKLENWLFSIIELVEQTSSDELRKEVFEKLIKKALILMLRETYLENLKSLCQKLIDKFNNSASSDITKAIINLIFLQVLDKTHRKIHQPTDVAYLIEKTLIEHFITSHASLNEDAIFLLCSTLIRQTRISTAKFDPKTRDYFKSVLDECLGREKKHRKRMRKPTSTNSQLNVSNAYVDYLKSLILFSESIRSVLDDDVLSADELFEGSLKSALVLYLSRNESVRLEFNPCLVTSKNTDDEQDPVAYLIRSLTYGLNNVSVDRFKCALDVLEQNIDHELVQLGSDVSFDGFVRLARFLKTMASDFELKQEFKDDFSKFLQKFLVQMPAVIMELKFRNENEALISLLEALNETYGSKYFLLPSHLVISTLQLYAIFSYEQMPIESLLRVQELVAKLLNIILTRYSKKFANIAGVVCTLLIRLMSVVTTFANQNTLKTEQHVELAIRSCQIMERIVTQLASFKKYFSKLSPYIMSEFFHKANTLPIHASVKGILSNVIYNLIDLCDLHGIAMMHVVLPPGPKEIFKGSLTEHAKFFKYTGTV